MKHPWEDIDSCSYFTSEAMSYLTGEMDPICGSPTCVWYDATGFPAYRSAMGRCKIHPVSKDSKLALHEISRDEAIAMSVMAI